ncbi:serine/threonine-protein kinase [Actinomadura darangshiensis]|nr:serine/threonine-protein kinase [Actinomadura darangshiensis]
MSRVIAARYELLEALGRGGMGTVWRARDRTLGREVAVKEVSLPQGLDESQVERLYARTFREARSAARLDHPGIVTVFDVVEEDDRPWIVMQLVRAEGLDKVIAREGPLPPARVAAIGLDLLDALGAAHAAGVVHRDVKPGNVLLPRGRAVLTDFGIATMAGDETLTQAGAVVGSPAYLAPEQARHQKATPASDLWSLGATLYAAAEGRPPYRRPDVWGVMAALLSDDPDPLRLAGPLTPVLYGLLRKDPEQRMGPGEAGPLLRQAAQVSPVPMPSAPHNVTLQPPAPPTTAESGGASTVPPAPRRRVRWPLVVPAGIFTAALLAAVVSIVVFVNDGGNDQPGRSGSSSPSSGSNSSPGSSATVPAGYDLYRGSVFQAAVPKGWKKDATGDDATFTESSQGARGISLQRLSAALFAGTPGDALRSTAESFQKDSEYPGYQQQRFTRDISYMGGAAELEFTFEEHGRPARCRIRVFKYDAAYYQALLASDEKVWGKTLPYYDTFLKTLRPLA